MEGVSKLVAKYASIRAAATAEGIPYTTLRRWLAKEAGNKSVGCQMKLADANTKPAPGRSLSDFRSMYDKDTIIPARIKEALKTMGDWMYEVEFAKHAGVSLADLGAYRDQFADLVVTTRGEGRRAWGRTAGIAKQMREML